MPFIVIPLIVLMLIVILMFRPEPSPREWRERVRRRWFWSLLGIFVFLLWMFLAGGSLLGEQGDWYITHLLLPMLAVTLLLYPCWQRIGVLLRRESKIEVGMLPPEVQEFIAPFLAGRRHLYGYELEDVQYEARWHDRQTQWTAEQRKKREAAEYAQQMQADDLSLRRSLPKEAQVLLERRIREETRAKADALRRENEQLKAQLKERRIP